MKPRWLILAVATLAALLYGLGVVAGAESPKATAPTFTIGGMSVEAGQLVVRFKPVYTAGNVGAWDPEAAAKLIARLVVIGPDGVPSWTIYLPGLTAKDGPIPPPPPVPPVPPIPPVPPVPVPAELWCIVIEESAERTPQQGIVLASPKVRGLFPAAGGFRLVDKDSKVDNALQPYLDRAKGQKLPITFLVDPKGQVYYEGTLPATVDAMTALVDKIKKGGGK